MSGLNRTITGSKDDLIAELTESWQQAVDCGNKDRLPRYRREHWKGRAEGIWFAIRMLQDWQVEGQPKPTPQPADSHGMVPRYGR